MSELSRRVFLGTAGVAAGAAGLTEGAALAASEGQLAYEGKREKSEELPTFRFAMEQNNGHVTAGGSAGRRPSRNCRSPRGWRASRCV